MSMNDAEEEEEDKTKRFLETGLHRPCQSRAEEVAVHPRGHAAVIAPQQTSGKSPVEHQSRLGIHLLDIGFKISGSKSLQDGLECHLPNLK